MRTIAWYLNADRCAQFLGSQSARRAIGTLRHASGERGLGTEHGIAQHALKEAIEHYIVKNRIPTLADIAKQQDLRGKLFTIYNDFYCRGVSGYSDRTKLPKSCNAEIWKKITLPTDKRIVIRIRFSPTNLTCDTAWSRLAGHSRLFAVAYVTEQQPNEIIASPLLIGDPTDEPEDDSEQWTSWSSYGEIHPFSLDSFSKVRKWQETNPRELDLNILKKIPEAEIKRRFAQIIGEPFTPKDWGGEKSDLFTSRVRYNGEFKTAAFLLKGPAIFKELKCRDLGKNGDQIDRLFTEPAEILVLQHCHRISTAVRSQMKAYACRAYDPRNFVVIDGYDTLKILAAYRRLPERK